MESDGADAINPEDYLTIHTALEKLEEVDPQLANVVELRFFGGLSVPETADVLRISETSVKREWAVARVWLKTALDESYQSSETAGRKLRHNKIQ